MSNNKEPEINEAETIATDTEGTDATESTETTVDVLKARLLHVEEVAAKAQNELIEISDRYLRIAAEYDNYRKRTLKEHDNLYATAYADAVTAFLPVIDNLDRAVTFATDESELAKGVLMLKKQTDDILAKMKVEEIPSDGQPFDPDLHNAIMHEEDADSPENTVSATLQKGYRIGDKVIRYALVKVVN